MEQGLSHSPNIVFDTETGYLWYDENATTAQVLQTLQESGVKIPDKCQVLLGVEALDPAEDPRRHNWPHQVTLTGNLVLLTPLPEIEVDSRPL